jgi:hypothetical protein
MLKYKDVVLSRWLKLCLAFGKKGIQLTANKGRCTRLSKLNSFMVYFKLSKGIRASPHKYIGTCLSTSFKG